MKKFLASLMILAVLSVPTLAGDIPFDYQPPPPPPDPPQATATNSTGEPEESGILTILQVILLLVP